MIHCASNVAQFHKVQPQFYSPDDEVLLKSLLTTLADIDFDYEQERERVRSSTEDANLRSRVLQKLSDKHHQRREPYLQHLTMLQRQIMPQQTGR